MNRTLRILTLALLLILAMPSVSNAQFRGRLKKENAALKCTLDSLLNVLENGRKEFHERDSVTQEMLVLFTENENRRTNFLDPADFTPDVTDSLLDIWYLHGQVGDTNYVERIELDSVRFSSNVSDKVLMERLEKMNSFITLPYNETVRNYMVLYSEKMPKKMSNLLALSNYYMPIFEETFSRYGLPDEIKYLAIIESALNPNAVSRVGATGMWQFMTRTAKSYGLEVSSYVDERRDPFKSADAAARYLLDTYKMFGDWTLAISSYNCGPGNVNKAIRRSGNKGYWGVYNYLPRETRGYMPAFVGAMYAMHYCKEYGLSASGVEMPAQVDTFQIHHNLHFQQISDLVGISVEELRNLNPQYVRDIIPGNAKPYILRMPYQYTSSFLANEDSVYTHKADVYLNPQTLLESGSVSSSPSTSSGRIAYKVKKGDNLGRIAAKYHVTVNQLKNWNHLRSTTISIGQTLYIYGKGSAPAQTSAASSPKQSSAPASSGSGTDKGYVVYVVKKGDTLSAIASRYPGVSVKTIMDYNKISDRIIEGQKIRIPNR
ncbi:MAG: LysM peptidoglycan-binding domain-containing protein [Bacteroidales bacterium]|nr:LysM peptidoglycan-binding domain-containing protein [Bacteroidales bacterium]